MSKDASIGYLERIIRHMSGKIRSVHFSPTTQSEPAWWVLACGDSFDPGDLTQRDTARDTLRRKLAELDVHPRVFEWVWDDTNRAQLVVGRHHDRAEAETQASQLCRKGIEVRIVPSMKE